MRINPFIESKEKLSYAKEGEEQRFSIDCSAGSNPYGFSPLAQQAIESLGAHPAAFSEYPHDIAYKRTIIEFWSPYVALRPQQIIACNGSIDGIYMSNLLFQREDATVLGISPQFSDYVANARLHGYRYEGVALRREENYAFHCERLLDAMTPDMSLIYIDNPNNPTGQQIAVDDLRRILEKARNLGACVIADEAYGDYLPEAESAATLLGAFDNLIVLRSFSKGLGLAGLRAAYTLTSEELASQFDKISNPYVVSEPARHIVSAALRDGAFIVRCRDAFAAAKADIRANIGHKLHMAKTLDSCPIALLWHDDETLNLAEAFARHDVKVYSGSDFDGLGSNSVRLRVPHASQCAALLDVLRAIDA